MKPTFLIMGTQKGATTSLYDALSRHPMMGRATKKELHFFDRYYHSRGWHWYSQQFRMRPRESQVGEATPVYMYLPEVRDRIAEDLPDVRIVITLRDPVARAYSHFWHSRRYDREPLEQFEAAVAAEPARLAEASEYERMWWSYIDRGRYVDQLEAIEKRHGRDAMCVVTLEELKADPAGELSRILQHLRLDPELMRKFRLPVANTYHRYRPDELRRMRAEGHRAPARRRVSGYPAMAPGIRDRVAELFADHDARLSSWLGRPLPWRSAGR